MIHDGGCSPGWLAQGVSLRSHVRYGRGNVVKIRPPLILTVAEAELICSRLDAVFQAVEN
jgi:4-aminobutyrate aminotransferase